MRGQTLHEGGDILNLCLNNFTTKLGDFYECPICFFLAHNMYVQSTEINCHMEKFTLLKMFKSYKCGM